MSERELPAIESASVRAFETIYRFKDGRIAAVHNDDDVQEYADYWTAIAEYERRNGEDEFREGDEEVEWKPLGLITEDGLNG